MNRLLRYRGWNGKCVFCPSSVDLGGIYVAYKPPRGPLRRRYICQKCISFMKEAIGKGII
jgi:hypothetical protein